MPTWHHREKGGAGLPGESPIGPMQKALAMPMAGPAMWKRISFLSGVNLGSYLPPSSSVPLDIKEGVVTHDLLP